MVAVALLRLWMFERLLNLLYTYGGARLCLHFYYIYTDIYALKSHVVNFRTEISSGQSEERTTFFNCEKHRSSNQRP